MGGTWCNGRIAPQARQDSGRSRSWGAFIGPQSAVAVPGITVGLRDPIADRLRRWFELAGQFLRRAAGTNQLDHLPAEFRGIDWLLLGHRGLLQAKVSDVHGTGQLQITKAFCALCGFGFFCAFCTTNDRKRRGPQRFDADPRGTPEAADSIEISAAKPFSAARGTDGSESFCGKSGPAAKKGLPQMNKDER